MKIITILGCGRSGTSLTAETLMKSGVDIGNHTTSTFENTSVRKINDSYLSKHYNANINSINFYGILPTAEIQATDNLKQNSTELINKFKNNSSKNYFCYKDPRTVVLHDAWVPETDIIISIYRNPIEVSKSLMKMFHMHVNRLGYDYSLNRMIDYWCRFNQSLLHVYKNYDKPNYLIKFDDSYNDQLKIVLNSIGIESYTPVYNTNRISNKYKETIPESCLSIWNELEQIKHNN